VPESDETGGIRAAEVVLPCAELDRTLRFFCERLGFRLHSIAPAEDPRAAVVIGHGLRLRLERGADTAPGVLRLHCRDPVAISEGAGGAALFAPNGTRIELVAADAPPELLPARPAFVLSRAEDARWVEGRAGMLYRDLLPGHQGGRWTASHIRIPSGGPVPDYVHFHAVRFQTIVCRAGWVRLVYEDQGPPFVLNAGDCVLQPPRIRHRVLACSDGLEVVEVGSPADHETFADHELDLPTPVARPAREFAGQRFVRHAAAGAEWRPWRCAGFECRDTGIAAATRGLASVRVVHSAGASGATETPEQASDAELLFLFVLSGSAELRAAGRDDTRLAAGDAVMLPPGQRHVLARAGRDLELLEVASPAPFTTHEDAR
jgi:quercetin dioxygenase-like cupin family protein